MRKMIWLFVSVAAVAAVAAESPAFAEWGLAQMVTETDDQTTYHARPVPESLRNRWPDDLEAEFQQRAGHVIRSQRRDTKAGVNTYFENEKRTYGFLMAHVLGGNAEQGLQYLQARDHQSESWHRGTAGIDYYACFTLKHQMRKYFYFGELLEPAYRKTMYEGAKAWTKVDPLRRPHDAYQPGTTGWGPDARNSWVDVRSTENLWLMRTTSVYLMAEETGNEATAEVYRQRLLDYTKTLYRVGIGEWDSENYHGHSIAPLLNLYDFAKDRDVRAAAKACLDFYAAAGAVKYWRGGFNGPSKRDYNHAQPFGGSAANSLWMWFGDHPSGKADEWESDEVHQITSAYRPPLAVVNLARRRFERPVEIFAAKPPYDATTRFRSDSRPEYSETQYIAHSYQLGSLTGGTSVDGGDVNGFKMLVFDEAEGAVALHAVPGSNPATPGSPLYQEGAVSGPNRVAQQENLAIWLVQNGRSPWLWVVPDDIQVRQKGGVTFLRCDRTWVAIRPLGKSEFVVDDKLTRQLEQSKKNRFPDHQVLRANGRADAFCGFAVEVGERESHGTFEQFVASVRRADVDVSQLDEGVVRYKSDSGQWLGIHWNDDPMDLGVWRNGKRRQLAETPLYDSPVIRSAWGAGQLEVETPGARFRCRVDDRGIADVDETIHVLENTSGSP